MIFCAEYFGEDAYFFGENIDMIQSFVRTVTLIIIVCMIPIYAAAAAPAWQIVPVGSTIKFSAIQNGAPITGEFKTFTGTINFDPSQLSSSNVRIVVNTDSVSTSYGEIADTLKTADWFNVKVFPQAVFTANNFTKTGDKTYQANGTLTIRNKTLPVTLIFNLDEYAATKAHATGSTTIKRTLFGVGQGDWSSTDQIKDDVQINFALTTEKK